ncbi:hypothetical protein BJ741DRAFT_667745 [Chytriomyces cf. hyalinus JEL632]|nr:hypothetical protein BJ741DRAFT_667745 [Chytriomyces cf. hyalinus JEL632]
MLEIRDGSKQRDNDEENDGDAAEQCSDGEGEREGGAARSTRDAAGGGRKDNESASRNPAHIRSGSGRSGVGVGVGVGSSSQTHTANASISSANNNPATSHMRRCAFTLFNLSNSCVNANRDGREQPIIFSSNSGLRSLNLSQSSNMNSVYSSLHSCTPTVGALTQAAHAPLIHIALNSSLLFAPNPSQQLAPSHPQSHSHHWPYPYPFTSYTTPHSTLPILPLGHPFAADTLDARIDTLVRLHCHARGFSDVVALAVKLVAHLSIGWHSRYDLYLESTSLFDAIKLSSSLNTRKRMSSEMLHQAQQSSNSSQTATPDEGGFFVHRSANAESSGHALMRSLSEASVISADSTYSVTNSLSTLSASSPPAATHKALPLQQKTPLSSPLFYAPHELAELRGTSLESLISAQTFQQFYNTLFPALVAIQDSLFFRSQPSNISAGNGSSSNAQFLTYPPIPVTAPASNHPSRSRVDPSLLTNSAAFRAALGLVLSRGIRVCPPPQSNAQQHSHRSYGSDAGASAPWYAVGSVIGNVESVLAGGWKRRLVGQPFEMFGPLGGGCGLFGLEEVFGRAIPPSFESVFGSGLKTGKRDISGGNFDEPGVDGMDQDEDTTRNADVSTGDEMDDVEMGCRKAWGRRNNVTAGGFVALVPIVDMLERKTKSASAEFEDDIRHWKFQQQGIYREQLEKNPQGFSQMHQFRVQPPPSIPGRVDIRLEFSPASAYLVSDHGDEVIRLEPDDLDGMVGIPPGYHIAHHRAQFSCYGTNSTFPLQKWTMQTGNLSNYHLMLCHGSIEEKNMNEILDIPVDLIEDAVTSHLEHFGPASRALHVLRSLHSSKSAFNLNVDMQKRYRTASERITGSAKGKSKAKYDIVTYENARALLKAMGVFPGDSGILRCKSEFFWQDETLNTIIQVLLMSRDQFAEYELEPCMLDYNCINAPQSADSTDSSASESESETVPQPRANIIPTNNARRRGRLPFREGANEAFLAVFCGILRRRLLMYPTTYLEDLHLMQRMSLTEQVLAQKKDAAAAAGKGGLSSVIHASAAQSPLAKVASSVSISAQLGEAGNEASGEHEGKRRRKSHDRLISTVPAPGSAKVSSSALATNRVSATNGAESGVRNDKEEKLKTCRSDDTLVAGPTSAPDASPASSWTETASPVLTPKNASIGPVKHPAAPSNVEPAPFHPQQTFAHPTSSHISSSTPLEWVSPNRLMVIRFRMCEKRQLHQNIKFLETMVEKYYTSMIVNSRQPMDGDHVVSATNGGHKNPATVTGISGVAVGGYGVRGSEFEAASGDMDSVGHFDEEDEDDDVSDYSLSDEYSDGFVSGEMNR